VVDRRGSDAALIVVGSPIRQVEQKRSIYTIMETIFAVHRNLDRPHLLALGEPFQQ
jgi:hypothetical protein